MGDGTSGTRRVPARGARRRVVRTCGRREGLGPSDLSFNGATRGGPGAVSTRLLLDGRPFTSRDASLLWTKEDWRGTGIGLCGPRPLSLRTTIGVTGAVRRVQCSGEKGHTDGYSRYKRVGPAQVDGSGETLT